MVAAFFYGYALAQRTWRIAGARIDGANDQFPMTG